jgi:hypothetical protein
LLIHHNFYTFIIFQFFIFVFLFSFVVHLMCVGFLLLVFCLFIFVGDGVVTNCLDFQVL